MLIEREPPPRGSAQEKAYFGWVAQLPCIVTGLGPVQVAHIRGADSWWAKELPGMARKPSLPYVVPLIPRMHVEQEAGNRKFWAARGWPWDPAQDSILFDCWFLWRCYAALGPLDGGASARAYIRHGIAARRRAGAPEAE